MVECRYGGITADEDMTFRRFSWTKGPAVMVMSMVAEQRPFSNCELRELYTSGFDVWYSDDNSTGGPSGAFDSQAVSDS